MNGSFVTSFITFVFLPSFLTEFVSGESASECTGSSVDDQSSVAGHMDSARDQTVSSPLHPSASQARPPTPDPLPAHHPDMTPDVKAGSAAATAVGRSKGGRGVKAEGLRKGRAGDLAEGLTGGEGGDAPLQWGGPDGAMGKASPTVGGVRSQLGEGRDGVVSKPAGAGVGVGAGVGSHDDDSQGFVQAEGSSKSKGPAMNQVSLEGFQGFQGSGQGQGPGKAKGPSQGQRPSSAPTSPVAAPGKMVKPSRCQKCHTCRHKQLKKQCLRNKASSPSSLRLYPCITPAGLLYTLRNLSLQHS